MATQTPNLGLTLPVGTENVSRQVINGNNTLIDTFAGGVNTAMNQMGSNLGILETGDTATHAIAKGEYVTWKGASYTADAAISIGETLAATGGSKNLTACDKGIANALNSNIGMHTYSTEKHKVGVWVDGTTPVYEKTFVSEGTTSINSLDIGEAITKLVSLEGTIRDNSGNWAHIGGAYNSGQQTTGVYITNNRYLRFNSTGGIYGTNYYVITVRWI